MTFLQPDALQGDRYSRTEATANFLLDIFDKHMPLLYGDGRHAFTRLQEDIFRTPDERLLLV